MCDQHGRDVVRNDDPAGTRCRRQWNYGDGVDGAHPITVMPKDLAIVRRTYARHILAEANVRSAPLERAFAAVPREAFLGRGPWQILRWGRGYVPTPSADPLYLYADLVVPIRPQDRINNGEPSFHARLMAALAPRPGEHIVHVGAGTGYYTAVLAELVGSAGRVTAFEVDKNLAARARRNLTPKNT